MQPNLVPISFATKHMRKRYHSRRMQRTWMQFVSDHHNVFLVLAGASFVIMILYLKYQDKRLMKATKERSHPHSNA